ncbi:hypothetical protein SporoP37_07085 [Sporosarcina sp. P37]|uniref:universal stress protein n=1 Tax=unclassified Sporosarcina TaxID=2647733 RepID=UPI0009C19633|nr:MULTISPECIES: universal stress protein [unclassified Sporosarcina]ARD47927.1 hypothetical protein SporoP33_06605 [Sporosarcina sp. P33]ARK24457.1 hypothetical protein SporoP37_07085 [Sporosarcina sp. P37]PID18329.1 universal stress protein [Sporosarcina sp. P35]
MNKYDSILAAVDGSDEAKHALLTSIEMAKNEGCPRLHIVSVIDVFSISEEDTSYLEKEQLRVNDLLTRYKTLAENEGIEHVEIHMTTGDPKVTIPEDLAPSVKARLIVCGAQGLKNAEHYFLGSVSEAIVMTAACDVLVVRRNR